MNRQAVISLESPLAGRFVNDAPEPTNDVAVTTPVAIIPLRAVISPTAVSYTHLTLPTILLV